MARNRFWGPGILILIGVGIVVSVSTALAQATPTSSGPVCVGPGRSVAFFEGLGTPPGGDTATPGASAPVDLVAVFPVLGEAPVNADVEAVMATLGALTACQNAGDFARLSALFTDDYWRGEVGLADIAPAKASQFAGMVGATPVPAVDQVELRASFSDPRLLPDGRIVGFHREDGCDLDDTQLIALREVDGLWLIDEVVFVDEMDVFGTPGPTEASPAP